MTKVTDEMLMALADGELDPETAAAVMRSVEADPLLRARLEDFRRTRALAKEAFGDVLSEEMPARLVDTVRRQRRPPRSWSFGGGLWGPLTGALAASVAGFVLAALILGQPGTPLMAGDPQLAAALDAAPSGTVQPWHGTGTVRLSATYLASDGVCRSFTASSDGAAWRGVACRRPDVSDAWQVEVAVSDRAASADAFIPASDRATRIIDAFLDVAGADQALDAAAEAQLMQNGWAPRAGAE
jgi:anti-sigma factor RsiW